MKILKIIAPLVVLAVGVGFMKTMLETAPEAERKEKKVVLPVVEVIRLKTENYPIKVHSHGTVEPSTQTTIVAEVSGIIVETESYFNDGNYFKKGDAFEILNFLFAFNN